MATEGCSRVGYMAQPWALFAGAEFLAKTEVVVVDVNEIRPQISISKQAQAPYFLENQGRQ